MRKYLFSAGLAFLVLATPVCLAAMTPPAFASTIKYIVNDTPVTTGDIQHRAAFLKLQRKKGNAAQEMIDQALRLAEARRLGIRISDAQVNEAYARFASNNKMQLKQLDGVMAQSGVTKEHFKEFIRAQMAWNQALSARYRAEQGGTGTSEQEMVRRMLEKGGNKPSATEYMLQQVIFVVPAAERKSSLAKRKREAEAMRGRFNGCEHTPVRQGPARRHRARPRRVLAPQLPPDWADQIKKTAVGGATAVRETERGVEFIGVCSSREVSDDKVAQLMLDAEGKGDDEADALSTKYLGELKAKARIVER